MPLLKITITFERTTDEWVATTAALPSVVGVGASLAEAATNPFETAVVMATVLKDQHAERKEANDV